MADDTQSDELVVKQHPLIQRSINKYVGTSILLFLSILAVVVLIAAVIAAVEIIIREFPKLVQPTDEYGSLQHIIESLLLVAIAAELSLLLLFHKASAAVEIVIFIVARKMVNPSIAAIDLLLGAAALSGLIIVRFYYLREEPN
ncbi:MAG: hypothetical protein DMF61_14340 [Blastocatellia bacterium AA13]|nr:MAG: hypothetical protein DMF61_14340 [Blastocatellia bacterium AA13]